MNLQDAIDQELGAMSSDLNKGHEADTPAWNGGGYDPWAGGGGHDPYAAPAFEPQQMDPALLLAKANDEIVGSVMAGMGSIESNQGQIAKALRLIGGALGPMAESLEELQGLREQVSTLQKAMGQPAPPLGAFPGSLTVVPPLGEQPAVDANGESLAKGASDRLAKAKIVREAAMAILRDPNADTTAKTNANSANYALGSGQDPAAVNVTYQLGAAI